jgi:hypothetical protein
MFDNAKNFNQPIYFKYNENLNHEYMYYKTEIEGQESKYVLEPKYYSKLLLYYVLNKINHDLLYLCDDVEEYYVCDDVNDNDFDFDY